MTITTFNLTEREALQAFQMYVEGKQKDKFYNLLNTWNTYLETYKGGDDIDVLIRKMSTNQIPYDTIEDMERFWLKHCDKGDKVYLLYKQDNTGCEICGLIAFELDNNAFLTE